MSPLENNPMGTPRHFNVHNWVIFGWDIGQWDYILYSPRQKEPKVNWISNVLSQCFQPSKSTSKVQWTNNVLFLLSFFFNQMSVTVLSTILKAQQFKWECNVRYFVYWYNRWMWYHCSSSNSKTKWPGLQLRLY